MMASRPATKYMLSSYLKNVGHGHHLQKSLYLSYYTTDFYQTFTEIMAPWPARKMSSADLENIGQCHHLQNHISAIIQLILPNFYQNDDTGADNKNVTSAFLDSAG